MKIATRAVAFALVLAASASPLYAGEGFFLVETTVTGAATRTTQVQIERDRMRAELGGPTGGTQLVIFEGPQQLLRIVNVDRKSYTEMTKADADRMGAQVSAVLAAMKSKVANMPPEQRAKMEALMNQAGGAAPGAAPAKPEYKRTGTDKVGKWTCDKYEGFREGVKVSEICAVDPKVIGLTPADFEISKQVGAFFKSMMPQAGDQLIGIGTVETQGFAGVPIRRVSYRAGKPVSTTEVTEVGRRTFAPSSYEVPAGFERQVWRGLEAGKPGAK